MFETILQKHQPSIEKFMEHYTHELNSVRTGRATTALLSTVHVDVYGSMQPIEHVASITVSDPKTLTITPWDKSNLQPIEKAIRDSNLGYNPTNDGSVVRISIPAMTEDRRKEMVKMIKSMEENSRIALRQVREDILKELKRGKEDSVIREDDFMSAQKKLQDIVDKYNNQIKTMAETKEKEVMTV